MPSVTSLVLASILPPLLFALSFPLVFFAALTTTLAFAALLIRVSLLYCELGGALIRSCFAVSAKDGDSQLRRSSSNMSLAQHRARSSSIASSASQELHPQPGNALYNYDIHKNDSFASLLGAGVQGSTRDYEGIGGWRDEDNDPDREAIWLGMNRRLELPASSPPSRRHHRRSYTGGSQVSLPGQIRPDSRRWSGATSPETLRMSPVQSRARTPSVTERNSFVEADEGEYFSPFLAQHHARDGGDAGPLKTGMKEARGKDAGKEEKEARRKSGDSINSMASRESREGTKRVRYV